jgi:hypothetical protein
MASFPGNATISSSLLFHQAAKAMQNARDQRLTKAVIYSEIAS